MVVLLAVRVMNIFVHGPELYQALANGRVMYSMVHSYMDRFRNWYQ